MRTSTRASMTIGALQQRSRRISCRQVSFPEESANSLVTDIDGDTLVIGARRWNLGDGRVFVYEQSRGCLGAIATIHLAASGQQFRR